MSRTGKFMKDVVGTKREKPGGQKERAGLEKQTRYSKSQAEKPDRGKVETAGHRLVGEVNKQAKKQATKKAKGN